jgi:hypothetical protein
VTAWFYHAGGQQFGPVPATEIRRLLAAGELTPDDMAWREGLENWLPIGKVPELNPRAYNPAAGGAAEGPIMPATSGMAVTSMVLGIVSMLVPCVGLVTGILAVIFGGAGLSQINRSRGRLSGKGMAVTGLVTGVITLSLYLTYVILVLAGTLATPHINGLPK